MTGLSTGREEIRPRDATESSLKSLDSMHLQHQLAFSSLWLLLRAPAAPRPTMLRRWGGSLLAARRRASATSSPSSRGAEARPQTPRGHGHGKPDENMLHPHRHVPNTSFFAPVSR